MFPARATYTSDTSGNIAGLAGAGATIPLNAAPGTVLLLGDSITSECNNLGTPTAATRTSNVVTMTLASHGLGTNSIISVYGIAGFNATQVALTRVDANTFTYPCVGADGAATIDSTYARVMYEAYYGNNSFFVYCNGLLGGGLKLVKNFGQSSETTAMMAARVSDLASYAAQECWVLGGANDVVGSTTVATTIASLKSIYAQLRGQGRVVRAITILPLGSGHASFSTATPKIQQINEWIRQYCRKTPGMVLVDGYASLVNTANGAAASNVLRADNVHLQTYGAYLLGQAIKHSYHGQVVASGGILTSCAVDDYATNASNPNIWQGAPWVATGGTISDVVSGVAGTGFNVSSSGNAGRVAVASAPSRADGYGFNQRVVFTPAAANDTVTIQQQSTAALAARVAVGEQYILRCALKTTNVSGSNLSYIRTRIQGTFDGTTVALGAIFQPTAFGTNNVATDMDLVLESAPMVIPPFTSCTSISVEFIMVFTAAGTAITLDVGRVSLVRVNNS